MNTEVVVAILAAGGSSRLGRPKQLVEIDGEALIRRVARRVGAAFTTGVVVGARADDVTKALGDAPVRVLSNEHWQEGLSTSVKRAVAWAREERALALILVLGDQPLLDAAHLEALVLAWRAGSAAVASLYFEKAAVPALFDASLFGALEALEGDTGAARILRGRPDVTTIHWPAGETDIDTEDDVRAWRAR